jgi:hypothetical protein
MLKRPGAPGDIPCMNRLGGLAGLAFVALSGVIVVVSPFWPPLGTAPDAVHAYYSAHRLPFLVGNYVALLAIVPSFIQLAVMVRLVQRAEGEGGWKWITVLSTAIVAHALGGLALVIYQAVPFDERLSDLAGVAFATSLIGLGSFAAFGGWAITSTRALPAWCGWLGYPAAALCFFASLGSIWSEPASLAGGGLISAAAAGVFFAWCLAVSVALLRAGDASPVPALDPARAG